MSKLLQEIGSSMYQQSTQADVNQASSTSSSSVDNNASTDSQEKVVDGEYDVVDENSSTDDK